MISGHESGERAEPRLVAAPGVDGLTVNWLASLPLARRLDETGIALGPQAGRVPRQASASALARYRLGSRVNVQVNINNIATRRYYDGLDDNHVNVSAGRSALLSVILQK